MEWRAALDAVLAAAGAAEAEPCALDAALGRVLAGPVFSHMNVPPFDNSAMDGFALRAADTAGSIPDRPARLRVVGCAAAGSPWAGVVGPGEAVEIMTGAPMPDGADSVVRVEETQRAADEDGVVLVASAVEPASHVRRAGGDTRAGDLLAPKGAALGSPLLGLLASCGVGRVSVHRRPKVALAVGGDELAAVGGGDGQPLPRGRIFDSNRHLLGGLLGEHGFACDILPNLPDDPAAMRAILEGTLDRDVVLTTGGVSMGRFDHVRAVLADLGAEEVFWRVNQQPGGPMLFARRGRTAFVGLPGNPVSCWVCTVVYVLPLLRRLSGLSEVEAPRVRVWVGAEMRKPHGKVVFVRASLERDPSGRLVALPTGAQDSNRIRSLGGQHGLLVFPPSSRCLAAGDEAEFLVTDPAGVLRAVGDIRQTEAHP